jgi:hypothetical protein
MTELRWAEFPPAPPIEEEEEEEEEEVLGFQIQSGFSTTW